MKFTFLLLFFSLTPLNSICSLDPVNETFIKYVNSSKKEFKTIEELHAFLVKPAKNEREKAELFFYWISQHISYDIEKAAGVLAGQKYPNYNSLLLKKGVCADYSDLFKSLCDLSGIECYRVSGYPRSENVEPNTPLKMNHAWNIVKIEGEYLFIDCTWASGTVGPDASGKMQYKKDIALYYVLVNSNKFRESHLPGAAKWQLLDQPISYSSFAKNRKFENMEATTRDKFNFRDSIQQFKALSKEERLIQEMIDIYDFHPTYKKAMKCGKHYEVQAQALTKKAYAKANFEKAKRYYQQAKKWYVKSFKMTNKDKNKADRNQIEIIKKVNKRITYCERRMILGE